MYIFAARQKQNASGSLDYPPPRKSCLRLILDLQGKGAFKNIFFLFFKALFNGENYELGIKKITLLPLKYILIVYVQYPFCISLSSQIKSSKIFKVERKKNYIYTLFKNNFVRLLIGYLFDTKLVKSRCKMFY